MKKLIQWFKTKTSDKQKHVMVGFICGFMYFPFVFIIGLHCALFASFTLSSLLFFGKEIYDEFKPLPTGFDWVDLFADYIGYSLGVIVGGFIAMGIKVLL